MPPSTTPGELTSAEVAELQEDLHVLERELREGLVDSEAAARPVELDQAAVGRVSRIDAIQQQTMVAANRAGAQIRLAQVMAAIGAVEREEYGYCKACEEPIAFRRLKVRPEAPFCVRCQGAREPR